MLNLLAQDHPLRSKSSVTDIFNDCRNKKWFLVSKAVLLRIRVDQGSYEKVLKLWLFKW